LGHVAYRFAFEDIPAVLDDPQVLIRNAYGWGTDDFDADRLFRHLENLLVHWGAHVYVEYQEAERVALLSGRNPGDEQITRALKASFFETVVDENRINAGIGLFALPKFGSLKPGLSLLPFTNGTLEEKQQISRHVSFSLKTSLDMRGGLGIALRPEQGLQFVTDFNDPVAASAAAGEMRMRLASEQFSGNPSLLIGSSNSSRIEYGALSLVSGIYIDSESDPDLLVEIELVEGKVFISATEGDGFLQRIIPDSGIDSDFELAIGMSSRNGLYFRGSGGLEIQLPIHLTMGPVNFEGLTIKISPSGQAIPIGVGANVKANLGPLSALINDVGIRATFEFAGDNSGNLGPLNFGLGFNPPRGIGANIDAGAVKGGGYLYFDPDREEYAGDLELVLSDWITVKAIGLVTTQMPDDSDGFSLLVIVTAEFGTGFQLGYGFTLEGVGGLLGWNRGVNLDALKEGIRTGSIENVMFPQNVVENAPRIISDLRRFFPPQPDVFLIGPMAKIGWGTPTLMTADVAVILEFPNVDITILGVVKVLLPDEDSNVLRLQVNFIGRVEPSNSLLWFYAELYDSRVLGITLEGQFGLLMKWGNQPNFVLSAGGFHPDYQPPPLPFAEPQRIAANLLNEAHAKVRVEGYVALTSNTAQFGGSAEVYFGLRKFRVEGDVVFDALFQFDPFYFTYQLSARLSVKAFGVGLFTVGFSGVLEGPTPWYIEGKGKISLFLFSLKVPFKHRWGESRDTQLESIEVLPLVQTEFAAFSNWEARVPESNHLSVSLRKLDQADTDQLVLHPVGKLRISQRKVPLNFSFDKIGNQRPADVQSVVVGATLPGAATLNVTSVEDPFAIGQFKDLDAANQLSSPGFQALDSGIEIAVSGAQHKTSGAVRRVIRYETIIIDQNYKRHVKRFFGFFAAGYAALNDILHAHFLTGNSVTQSPLSKHHQRRVKPFEEKIELKPTLYTVASTVDNKPHNTASMGFTSQAKAQQYLEGEINKGKASSNDLHVVPNTELNLAA